MRTVREHVVVVWMWDLCRTEPLSSSHTHSSVSALSIAWQRRLNADETPENTLDSTHCTGRLNQVLRTNRAIINNKEKPRERRY